MNDIQRELELYDFWKLMYVRTEDRLNTAIDDDRVTWTQIQQLMKDYEFARHNMEESIEIPW